MITLPKDVIITDPCYSKDTWCQVILHNVKPGRYYIDIYPNSGYDLSNGHAFLLTHENYLRDIHPRKLHKTPLGMDSGQIGVYPLEFYGDESLNLPVKDKYQAYIHKDSWYFAHCSEDMWNIINNDFTCDSGYGDGEAELYYDKDGDEIIRFAVIF
jgi:hypothetical protein